MIHPLGQVDIQTNEMGFYQQERGEAAVGWVTDRACHSRGSDFRNKKQRQCLVVVTRKGIYWKENRGESAGQKQGAHTINAF